MTLRFGRAICGALPAAESREWLVTNGIGGYASGTVAGLLTRRYHGILVAALQPPLGRTVLVAKVDEILAYDGAEYPLFTNRWRGGTVDPHGYLNLESFSLEGTIPVWRFAGADALLEKRIWMAQGANTSYVRYQLIRACGPVMLSIKALVNYRDYHGNTHGAGWRMRIEPVEHGLRIDADAGAVPFYLLSDQAQATPAHEWYYGFELAVEQQRGLDPYEDILYAGAFSALLEPGQALTLVASTQADAGLDDGTALESRRRYERQVLAQANLEAATPGWVKQLVLAADQFIIDRPLADSANGKTVIAGYYWFSDWGRDTMISLPGLTLVTNRAEVARAVLRTFARYVDRGMLPNRFPDSGATPEYNTVDATLWYFEALRAYYATTGDDGLVQELFPVLATIIAWHQRGTRFGIQVDPGDGLLYAGEPGTQLTWMDVKIGDWVVTPRTGKPVEINALWYNALRSMVRFADLAG